MSRFPMRPRFDARNADDSINARLAWRKSLSDQDVRAMAADYWRGERDDCSEDAWAEYQHRFTEHKKSSKQSEKQGKRHKGRKSRKA